MKTYGILEVTASSSLINFGVRRKVFKFTTRLLYQRKNKLRYTYGKFRVGYAVDPDTVQSTNVFTSAGYCKPIPWMSVPCVVVLETGKPRLQ
jgi:hypothetical protein